MIARRAAPWQIISDVLDGRERLWAASKASGCASDFHHLEILMGKAPKKPKLDLPDPAKDDEKKRKASEAERRRASSQRGRASSIHAGADTFGTGTSVRAGLKSSLG